MKKLVRYLIPLLLVAAVAAGGYWLYRQRSRAAQTTTSDALLQTVAVQRGNLSASVSVVGSLTPGRQTTLHFERLSGSTALGSLDVAAGSTVQTGETLAAIDTAAYQQALDQANTALQEAEQTLADLQIPPTALDISQADLAVAGTRLKLAQAQADYDDLATSPDVSDEQAALDNAQDSLTLAQLQQQQAEHDSLAKSVRDLRYSVDWRERRIRELQTLQAQGKANAEQIAEISNQQESLVEDQADLARIEAQRKLNLDTAAAKVANAQADVVAAQQALNEAAAGSDALALASGQVNVQAARVALQTAEQARTDLDAGADETKLIAAQAAVDKKRLAVSEAEADLAGATLVAPFSGTVLAVSAAVDDRINAKSDIVTIADMSVLHVVASVDETTIRQISTGQKATITFDAFPGQTFHGAVLTVPLQGTLQGGVMVYDVEISLEGAEKLALLSGMTANVAIATGSVENALLIPTMAVQTVNGMAQVLVPNSSDPANPNSTPVELGLSNGTYTEVVRGLNEGDQVMVELSSSSSNVFGFGGPDGMEIIMGSVPAGGPPPGARPGN